MAGDEARMLVALDDEQVGPVGERQQRIGPLGIAGIGQHGVPVRDTHRSRRGARKQVEN